MNGYLEFEKTGRRVIHPLRPSRNTNQLCRTKAKFDKHVQKNTMIQDFCKETLEEINKTLPPAPYLEQVANGPHAAMATYIKLWRKRDDKNNIYIFQDEVQTTLNIKSHKFVHDLIDICEEGLLNWSKKKIKKRYKIQIEMTGWGDSGFDY